MENRKFLTESARISDAYSQMYARKAQVNESSECGSFNAELRKGDLPIEGKGSAKTGSKLGRRPMLPFEKRDAKSTAGHAVPMRKNRQFEKVCGNCKSTGGKAVNAGLTQDGLGKRDMLPFEKRDEKPTAIGRIAGVKDVGCVKGIKESEEDFEMDIIDTDAENGVSEIDADGSDEEACGCCEECKELFQTVSDVLEQIYDNLSDDDKALVDEVKAQIEEKLSDDEENTEDADSSEEEETDDEETDESVISEAGPKTTTGKSTGKGETTGKGGKGGKGGKRPTKVNTVKEKAISEITEKIKSFEKVNKNKNADIDAWKAETDALIDSKVSSGEITADEAKVMKQAVEKTYKDNFGAKDVEGNIETEIDELNARGKTENPQAYAEAKRQIMEEIKKHQSAGNLTPEKADALARQLKGNWERLGGDFAEIGKSIAHSTLVKWLLRGAAALTTAAVGYSAAKAVHGSGNGRDGLAGSGDAGVSSATKKTSEETKDAITNNLDNGSKDEQEALKTAAADAAKAAEEQEKSYAEWKNNYDRHVSDSGKPSDSNKDDKKDSREEGGLLTRAVGKGTKLFANSAKDIGDGIGGFTSGALGGVVKPVADLANALF